MPKVGAKKSLASVVKMPTQKVRKGPVWAGPGGEGPEGGITFSLLSRFLVCRERFRLLVVEGLQPNEGFNHYIEYGNMWHICEEYLARTNREGTQDEEFTTPLTKYAQSIARLYPTQLDKVAHWYNVCKVQFPEYVRHWANDEKRRVPILAEESFDLPYTLPSGRVVRLKGKWDAVFKKDGQTWLQENKSKSDIDEIALARQLSFDLQTMIYVVALEETMKRMEAKYARLLGPIRGVRYNVIRRPLSGGKGSIVKHKPSKSNPRGETDEEFYARLRGIIHDSPRDFFVRMNVTVTKEEVERFKRECLNPILEALCDWWEWVMLREPDPFDTKEHGRCGPHWRHPFGVRNILDEGGSSDVDEYLASGSTAGLRRAETLFPELRLCPQG